MNTSILNNYGISFNRQINGNIRIRANSRNLAIYIDKFTKQKRMLEEFISVLILTLQGNTVSSDDKEWSVELGLQIYTGIIQNDMTFDLFLEDHYEQTLEAFPLADIKEIFSSLLEFID